jgi:CHAT domain-containing protein
LRAALSYAGRWREALAPSDSLRSGAEFWLKGLYDAYIDATTRQGAAAAAFLAVEEERSASLLEMLLASGRGRRRSDRYWQDLAILRAAEIARIASPSPNLDRKTAQIRQRLLEEEAGNGIPTLYRAPYRAATVRERLTLVQRDINPKEALISLHLGETVSYIWAVTHYRLEMHSIAPAPKLASLATKFRRAVQDGAPERDTLGAELYKELFGKLSEPVLCKTAWRVASDDSLFDVPFSVLVVRRNNGMPVYLVEAHETARIPSADLARVSSPVSPRSTPIAGGQFLGIGDGIYNTADARFTRAHERPPGFGSRVSGYMAVSSAPVKLEMELPRLVSSAFELRSCAAAWNPRQPAILLTGMDVSQEKLRRTLETKPAILHIAAHILYPNGKPDQALIHLGLKPTGESEALTAKDVTSLSADGTLVVLSGCSSGAGSSVRGAGVMGLPRAWLLAGARGVLGGRWPVPDDTGELFRSFYSHLAATGLSRAGLSSALHKARLEMLRSNTWRSDPRYWGAFYLLTKD